MIAHHLIATFIDIRWLDVIDILLVAFLIYQLYNLTKGTVAIKIFVGIISIYLIWKLVTAFQMEMLGEILGQFMAVGVIALLIVFQQELRRFLLLIGNTEFFKPDSKIGGAVGRFLKHEVDTKTDIKAIVKACKKMAASKTGALIVIARKSDPMLYAKNADELDAKLSSRLIESIFYKNSPLHDGAIIIADDRIKVTRAVLPVTEMEDFPDELGMRHRSAVGITESSDAVSVIVSEQSGNISYAKDGKLRLALTLDELEEALIEDLTNKVEVKAEAMKENIS